MGTEALRQDFCSLTGGWDKFPNETLTPPARQNPAAFLMDNLQLTHVKTK